MDPWSAHLPRHPHLPLISPLAGALQNPRPQPRLETMIAALGPDVRFGAHCPLFLPCLRASPALLFSPRSLFEWCLLWADCPNRVIQFSSVQFSSVQPLSHVQLFATPWTTAHQASLSITNSWSLPKLVSFESMMPSNHLILCRPLLLLPSIFPSIRVFSNESAVHIKWPKY